MNRPFLSTAICLTALAGASPAMAVNIHNLDGKNHVVTITDAESGATETFTLYSGGIEDEVCTACRISIEGIGEIDAKATKP